MIAKREVWNYPESARVWVGKYRNSHNLLHWHYDCELVYVEQGCIDIFCDRRMHTLTAGGTLFVDSGQVHYMRARDPETVLIVFIFDGKPLKPFFGALRLADPVLTGNYPIPALYGELKEILHRKEPFCGAEAAGKILSLMAAVFRHEALTLREAADETTERFMQLLGRISENSAEMTFREAASFMGMSDAYFSRYFHRVTGLTFSKYVNFVRTEKAISLILTENGHTMTEVAGLCGFGTIRNFNRIFKELTGYVPTDLPKSFSFGERYVYSSNAVFDPTLYDCELLESVEN